MITQSDIYSIYAGCLGSLGSSIGKFTSSFENWFIQIVIFTLMIMVNTLGVTYFTKGLSSSPSSLKPTLISTASSYISTAIIGTLLFNETTSFLWWLGTGFVTAGFLLVLSSESKKTKNE